MTAADGQSLQGQSQQTQESFNAAYGASASQQWDQQHNQAIGAPAPAAPNTTQPTVGPDSTSSVMDAVTKALQPMQDALKQGSGITVQQLEEAKRQFDATLAQTQAQMQAIGIPQVQIAKEVADAQAAFQQGSLAVTQQQERFSEASQTAQLTGYFNAPTASGNGASGASGSPMLQASQQWLLGQNPKLADPAYQKVLMAARGWVYWPGEQLDASGNPTQGSYPGFENTPQGQQIAAQQSAQQTTGVAAGGATPQGTPTLANIAQQAQLSGQYNGAPTEATREFNASNSLAQGQLGLQYGTQAAQFAASNPFQLSDFLRGTAQQGGVPTYLQNLQNNVVQGSGAGPVGPNPSSAIRMSDITGNMQGGGGGYSQTDAAGNAISNIYQKGPNNLGAGTLESLTPDELTNLQQGINQQYGSAAGPAFLNAYKSNPVRNQTAAMTGYAAA